MMNYFQLTHHVAASTVDNLHRRMMSWISDAVGRDCYCEFCRVSDAIGRDCCLECEFCSDSNKRAISAEEKAWNLYCLGSSNHDLKVTCDGKRKVFHIPFESAEELSMRLTILGF